MGKWGEKIRAAGRKLRKAEEDFDQAQERFVDDTIDKVRNPGRTFRNFERNVNAFEDRVVDGVVDSSQNWLDTFDPAPPLSPDKWDKELAKTGPNRRVRARNKTNDEVLTKYRTAKQKRLELLSSGGTSGGASVVATKLLHPHHAVTHFAGAAGDSAKALNQQVRIEVYEAELRRRNLSTETNIDTYPTMLRGAKRGLARTGKREALSYTLSPITDPAGEVATRYAEHHHLISPPLPTVPTLNSPSRFDTPVYSSSYTTVPAGNPAPSFGGSEYSPSYRNSSRMSAYHPRNRSTSEDYY